MKIFSFLLIIIFAVSCSPKPKLTEQEKTKLDFALQNLVLNQKIDQKQYDVTVQANGRKMYHVIIYTSDAKQLQELGYKVNSIHKNFVTAQLTIEQIRKTATLSSVKAIQNGTKNYPQ